MKISPFKCVTGLLSVAASALLITQAHGTVILPDGKATVRVLPDRTVLSWTQSGKLEVVEDGKIEILLIGGGGGGGSCSGDLANNPQYGGGGGGAGGFVYLTNLVVTAGKYDITVGAGGDVDANGGNTEAFDLIAYGGGKGAAYQNTKSAGDGGSGGGATSSYAEANAGGKAKSVGEFSFGHDGGVSEHLFGPGGGGGAGAAGYPNDGSSPGNGGAGRLCSITGADVCYAGGGGGYRNSIANAKGGDGGGGDGGKKGEDGLGGGGGGGAPGGSGVVIISFTRSATSDTADFSLAGGTEKILLPDASIEVFKTSGTLNVTGSGCVEIFMVGGGGGGGAQANYGSGGGAGGVLWATNVYLTTGAYPVTVGGGGAAGQNGADSLFAGAVALGGGAGVYNNDGCDGGSGGGASTSASDIKNGGRVVLGYGNIGNRGGANKGNIWLPGGGGGAGAPGQDAIYNSESDKRPGDGGVGLTSAITGTPVIYAGGGGAGQASRGAKGGDGGGGNPGEKGTDGLGGGGGSNAAGGSGIVIIRTKSVHYRTEFDDATGGDIKKIKGYRVHMFKDDGWFTVPEDSMVDVLLVGGGGGGGSCSGDLVDKPQYGGGDGGAGGFIYRTNFVIAAGSHFIDVGEGGAVDANGGNTEAFNQIAYGGGNGAAYRNTKSAGNGGSGGGATAANYEANAVGKAKSVGEFSFGHDGGVSEHLFGPGGGGGAGAAGYPNDGSSPGNGGAGRLCSITGADVCYAGGGGGYRNSTVNAKGGDGGGGDGGKKGEDGLGGGGGGGAPGGKGIVIIRYKKLKKGMVITVR